MAWWLRQGQAGRYSQGFLPEPGTLLPIGGPWPAQSGDATEPPYRVPFLFATNGRPYLRQLETQSGIWHRDARDPSNRRRALVDWPTPEGLKAMLDIDRAAASAALTALPFDFAFGLRDYQMRGIQAVETALADDNQRALLLAMATGTGKTKLAVALLYRLLHANRFRRVCFVVDTVGEIVRLAGTPILKTWQPTFAPERRTFPRLSAP